MIAGQPRLGLVGLGERQGLDRAAQRGQRILQLVRDVGGEALDRLDAVVERLVMSRSAWLRWPISSRRWLKSGISGRERDAAADAVGGVGEAAERGGDGAGEEERQDAW